MSPRRRDFRQDHFPLTHGTLGIFPAHGGCTACDSVPGWDSPGVDPPRRAPSGCSPATLALGGLPDAGGFLSPNPRGLESISADRRSLARPSPASDDPGTDLGLSGERGGVCSLLWRGRLGGPTHSQGTLLATHARVGLVLGSTLVHRSSIGGRGGGVWGLGSVPLSRSPAIQVRRGGCGRTFHRRTPSAISTQARSIARVRRVGRSDLPAFGDHAVEFCHRWVA